MTMGLKEEFHPQNQCLLIIPKNSDKYIHLKYLFDNKSIEIESPFTQVQRPTKPFGFRYVSIKNLFVLIPFSSVSHGVVPPFIRKSQ